MPRIIAVAGGIATGKTQLLGTLSRELSLMPFRERWEENPWFACGLGDPFASQMWFLLDAGADHARMSTGGGGVQERCIHENVCVFARELLEGEELELLEGVYRQLDATLPDPALLVHLTASAEELHRRIQERGRTQERSVTVDYLLRLAARYRELINGWTRCPVIEIDTEAIDIRTAHGVRHVLGRLTEELS